MIMTLAHTLVADIETRAPARVTMAAPVVGALALLHERRRGAVIVEDDDGRMVGIFTERDLLTRIPFARPEDWAGSVASWMTVHPRSITPHHTLAGVVRIMATSAVRHLPVTDDGGCAVGILSIRDVLAHVAKSYPKHFINLPPEPPRQAHLMWGG